MRRSGKISIGCIIMAALLGVVGLAAYQIIPMRVRAAEIKDVIKKAAESAATDQRFKDDNIRATVIEGARANQVVLKENQIKIERRAQDVHVEAHYELTADILGYKYVMKCDPSYDAPRFD